jgi:hypothetical protein
MKRSFVYSAVTQFDTTNTSNDSAPFVAAGSGVIFGLDSFACGGLRLDSPGVSLLFSGRDPAFSPTVGIERLEGNQGRFCRAGGLPYSCTW